MPAARDYSITCYSRQGHTGDGVRYLQASLRYCNVYTHSISVDGIFGTDTYNALRSAQRTVGISADGVYGRQTAASIWFLSDLGGCTNTSGAHRGYVTH
jgi:lysozyme family protein